MSDKEKLRRAEKIAEDLEIQVIYGLYEVCFEDRDLEVINWLIEKVGKVEELQIKNQELMDLNDTSPFIIEELENKVNRYEQALKFYADENSYVTGFGGIDIKPTVMIDNGGWARKVLGK